MTDYVDGRCSPGEKREIDAHLEKCASCREFYELVRKGAVDLFRGAATLEAPASMWDNIRERIEKKEKALESVSRIFLPLRRAAFAAAVFALAIGLLAGAKAWRLYDTGLIMKYAQDQLYYFSEQETDEGADNGSFGTAVEEFLL